jgi:WD40 repeat protein
MHIRAILYRAVLIAGLIIQTGCTQAEHTLQQLKTTTPTDTKTINLHNDPTSTETQALESGQMTETPTSVHDVISTNTPIPIIGTPLLTEYLDGKIIILASFTDGPFYVEDVSTGIGRLLIPEEAIRILDWGGNGCTLVVNWGDDIAEIDLRGNLLQVLFNADMIPTRDGATSIAILSPDREWVYYLVGTGEYEDGPGTESYYEYSDLETISVDGEEGPYRLSFRGGAWRVAWSSDGQHLAFSDYDDNGIQQLFVTFRDGSNRQQLTYNTEPVKIMGILWSPDGERISAVVDQTNDNSADITLIIELANNTIHEFDNILAKWWRDNESLIAGQQISRELGYRNIIVLDVTTNWVSTIYYGGCYLINYFGNPALVGCLTVEDEFWVYDTITNSMEQYPQFDRFLSDITYWIAAPDSFPGEVGCGYLP